MTTRLPTTPDSREIARVRAQDSLTRHDERAASAARFGSRAEQQADYAEACRQFGLPLHRELAADFH